MLGALIAGFVPQQERAAPCRLPSASVCARHWCVSVPRGAPVSERGCVGQVSAGLSSRCLFRSVGVSSARVGLLWSRGAPDCNKALTLLLPCKGEHC